MPQAIFYAPANEVRIYCSYFCGFRAATVQEVAAHEASHVVPHLQYCRSCGKKLSEYHGHDLCRPCRDAYYAKEKARKAERRRRLRESEEEVVRGADATGVDRVGDFVVDL